jgi:hypothetical protein
MDVARSQGQLPAFGYKDASVSTGMPTKLVYLTDLAGGGAVMRTLLRVALVVAIALIGGVAHAADTNQYIVVLSLHGELTDAAVSAGGGVVTERFWDHVVARLTPSAIEALQSNHAVKYIQRIGETVDSPAAPRPEAHTMTVVPGSKADWAPPSWSSGAYQYDGSGNITAIGTSTTRAVTDGRIAMAMTSTRASRAGVRPARRRRRTRMTRTGT